MSIRLATALLADHVYQDAGTGKFILAGIFHQLNVVQLPTLYQRTFGLFISLIGVQGVTPVTIEFARKGSQQPLLRTHELEIRSEDPHLPIDFALEVPPIPIQEAGSHVLRIFAHQALLGELPLEIHWIQVETPMEAP